jgi:hypothetical protein
MKRGAKKPRMVSREWIYSAAWSEMTAVRI